MRAWREDDGDFGAYRGNLDEEDISDCWRR
jgi:hypothetical protein